MDIITALPMANRSQPPAVLGGAWELGALRKITSAGAPGVSVVDLVRGELPLPLQATLDRNSISLWQKPIALTCSLSVVGLEWLHQENGLPDVLLIHLEDESSSRAADVNYKRELEAHTRTNTAKSRDLLSQIFTEEVQFHDVATRGLAVMHADSREETLSAGDHVLEYLTATSESRFIHGRTAHVLTVVALQSFAIEILNSLWPNTYHKQKTIKKFSAKFLDYRHYLEWNDVFLEIDSKKIYRSLRDMLSIERRFDSFGRELQDMYSAQQFKNSSTLNRVGLLLASFALIPVWLTSDLTFTSNRIGVIGLTVAALVIAVTVFRSVRK